jgi:hypothetical protein
MDVFSYFKVKLKKIGGMSIIEKHKFIREICIDINLLIDYNDDGTLK